MLNIQPNSSDQTFLDFFKKYGYETIPGSSLLDPSVPMAFVMSAGLVQVESSAKLHDNQTESKYALIQNCFRYFDMEHVGNSNTHLSLFRMPGAFSFDCIDKRDIIFKISELLTDVYRIPIESLWITYFIGERIAGHVFDEDIESRDAWIEAGLKKHQIVGLKGDDNFWKQSSAAVGKEHAPKCGPNTEVFFDRGKHLSCGSKCLPGICSCGRFVELVNILFIMFNLYEDQNAVELLDAPFTEAVQGKERMDMVLQGVDSVYEIMDIKPIVDLVDSFVEYKNANVSYLSLHKRLITDHIRALLFLTADGAPPPGKGGRARLMRKLARGFLSRKKILNIKSNNFTRTVFDCCADIYSNINPKLLDSIYTSLHYVEEERVRFNSTLEKGYRKIDRMINNRDISYINGNEMLNMEKKEGIPIALLEDALQRKKINYEHRAYQKAHDSWKESTFMYEN